MYPDVMAKHLENTENHSPKDERVVEGVGVEFLKTDFRIYENMKLLE